MKTDKNQFSHVITRYFFFHLLALFWGLVYEHMGICKVGAELLDPHNLYIFHWLFSRWDIANYLPRLALTPTLLISVSQVSKILSLSHHCLIDFGLLDTKMCLADSGWASSKFTLKLFSNHLKIIAK
jgi:hypothetical protein